MKVLGLVIFAILFGSSGCTSYKVLYPEPLADKGLSPELYPDYIVVSVDQDVRLEKSKVEESEDALAKADEKGVVYMTTKVINVKVDLPGIVEPGSVSGDRMKVNFGKLSGGSADDPEVIIPVKRVSGRDTKSAKDDVYVLDFTPRPGEDVEAATRIDVSGTIYIVTEGKKAKITYKEIKKVEESEAEGKKPQSGGEK